MNGHADDQQRCQTAAQIETEHRWLICVQRGINASRVLSPESTLYTTAKYCKKVGDKAVDRTAHLGRGQKPTGSTWGSMSTKKRRLDLGEVKVIQTLELLTPARGSEQFG